MPFTREEKKYEASRTNITNAWYENLSADLQENENLSADLQENEVENSFRLLSAQLKNEVFSMCFDVYSINEVDFAKLKAFVVNEDHLTKISTNEVAKNLFADVEPDGILISADNFELPVNRLQISHYSAFILVAFYNGSYIECQRKGIHLSKIKIEPLLATFIFLKETCKWINFEPKTFQWMHLSTCLNILNVASFLQIDIVLQNISEIIYRKITPENLIPIYGITEIRHNPLAQKLWELMVRDFKVIVNNRKYLELNVEQFIALLKDPFLNIKPDEEVPLIRKWLQRNGKFYLLEEVEELYEACLSFEDSQQSKNSSKIASFFVDRPRYPQTIFLTVGGWDQTGPINHLEIYEPNRHIWLRVNSKAFISPAENRAYHGLVLNEPSLYVFGGFDGQQHHNSVRKFDLDTKEWQILAPMNEKRCYVSGSLLNPNKIFAAGGFNERERVRTAEIYDVGANQWTQVASMSVIRDAGCVTLRDKFYILGGFNGNSCHKSGEFYDPVKDEWFSMSKKFVLSSEIDFV